MCEKNFAVLGTCFLIHASGACDSIYTVVTCVPRIMCPVHWFFTQCPRLRLRFYTRTALVVLPPCCAVGCRCSADVNMALHCHTQLSRYGSATEVSPAFADPVGQMPGGKASYGVDASAIKFSLDSAFWVWNLVANYAMDRGCAVTQSVPRTLFNALCSTLRSAPQTRFLCTLLNALCSTLRSAP